MAPWPSPGRLMLRRPSPGRSTLAIELSVDEPHLCGLDDPFLYDFMTGRQPIATLKIAKDINPEAFADVDLTTEYDEFFQAMWGVSYPDYQPAS